MTVRFKTPLFISALIAAWPVMPASAQTQNPLVAARELYSAAAYEDALTILDTLPAEGLAGEREAAGLYRALCLFAVGRSAEANGVIDGIIQDNPAYRPSAEDMPPRIQVAFTNARRRLLPIIVQQKYNEGKSAYERQEYAVAAGVFKQVLDQLSDADLSAAANQPPLADLRTLAVGFYTVEREGHSPAGAATTAGCCLTPACSAAEHLYRRRAQCGGAGRGAPANSQLHRHGYRLARRRRRDHHQRERYRRCGAHTNVARSVLRRAGDLGRERLGLQSRRLSMEFR
jgi:tetratricopeptide (TPR) repeat protein